MNAVQQWFLNNGNVVQLVYGLSIAAIGAAILFHPRRASRFRLGRVLPLFAVYALLHAPADFIRMHEHPGEIGDLHYVALLLTMSSYLFLFEFGRRTVGLSRSTLPAWVLPLIVSIIVPISAIVGSASVLSVLFGNFIRLPAGVMAGLGLYWFHKANREELGPYGVQHYFFGAGVALLAWAFFCGIVRDQADVLLAGWINKPAFFAALSVPVHVFRIACAVTVVWGITGILSIFSREALQDLESAKQSMERELRERTAAQAALKAQREALEETVLARTEQLQRNYDSQKVLNQLQSLAIQEMTLEEFLEQALEEIVSIPWLGLGSKATFFLVEPTGDVLERGAVNGFDLLEYSPCQTVRFGECLCGMAAETGSIVHSSQIDDSIRFQLDAPSQYVQYCIPLVSAGETLGVISLYLRPDHRPSQYEEEFLQTAANALSGMLARRYAEEKLTFTRREYEGQLRSLASQLALVEEKERRRIATELHDRIGQNLAMARMRLSATINAEPGMKDCKTIGDVQTLLEQTVADTRSLTFEISPPVLYELGLEAALEWLTDRTREQHGIESRFFDRGSDKPLAEDTMVLLFQSARELLFNVVKYASASQVTVSISRAGEEVAVVIEDDGVGFDTTALDGRWNPDSGFGLMSIRERMAMVDGSFQITSSPGAGTRAELVAPVLKQAEEISSPESSVPLESHT